MFWIAKWKSTGSTARVHGFKSRFKIGILLPKEGNMVFGVIDSKSHKYYT